jgi:hypothetical protein
LLQRLVDQFNEDFAAAPILWILLGLCVMAQIGSWNAGGDLDRVCALTAEREMTEAEPEAIKEELDHICVTHRAEPS